MLLRYILIMYACGAERVDGKKNRNETKREIIRARSGRWAAIRAKGVVADFLIGMFVAWLHVFLCPFRSAQVHKLSHCRQTYRKRFFFLLGDMYGCSFVYWKLLMNIRCTVFDAKNCSPHIVAVFFVFVWQSSAQFRRLTHQQCLQHTSHASAAIISE